MKLASVARAFDRMPCNDAYTGALAFKGQFGLYDDNKRDSDTAERRILSTAPDVVIPDRRVIEVAGTRFIVGHPNPDFFRTSPVRLGWVLHEATELSHIQTLAQLCTGLGGPTAWAGSVWVKDRAEAGQSSALASQSHINFSATETVPDNAIVTFGDGYHIVRTSVVNSGGTRVCLCERMPDPVIEVGSVKSNPYDPVADVMNFAAPVSVPVVRIRWQSLFAYASQLAPKFGPEDVQLAIAKSSMTVVVGAEVTLSDGSYAVLSVDDFDGVWLCRAGKR